MRPYFTGLLLRFAHRNDVALGEYVVVRWGNLRPGSIHTTVPNTEQTGTPKSSAFHVANQLGTRTYIGPDFSDLPTRYARRKPPQLSKRSQVEVRLNRNSTCQ